MFRAVIKLLNRDDYVNLNADRFEFTDTWLKVFNGDSLVGVFDEGEVRSAWLSKKNGDVKR